MKGFVILSLLVLINSVAVYSHRIVRVGKFIKKCFIDFELLTFCRFSGALFTEAEKDSEVEFAFKYAVDRINKDHFLLPNTTLVTDIQYVTASDSFHASKKGNCCNIVSLQITPITLLFVFSVCGLLSRGVVAIFGPLARSTAMHVQSICDALEIPHIETRWDFQLQRDDLSINLYPRPSILTRAFDELIKAWSWKTFAIVYEENEAIMRLQGFYKEAQQRGWKVTLYQFKSGAPFRDIFWKIKQNHERNIVLDVKPQHIHKVLKHVSTDIIPFLSLASSRSIPFFFVELLFFTGYIFISTYK